MFDSTIWIASYPRSGNTFLRTILWHCFGLRSASIYSRDLGNNQYLEEYVGHIKQGPGGEILFPASGPKLLKTHAHPTDSNPAIYILRDGRAATVSLWHYYHGKHAFEDIIDGRNVFGTWVSHVKTWNPWQRPNTLLLRYEDIRDHLDVQLNLISKFLGCEVIKNKVPNREAIANVDGRFVRKKSDWRGQIDPDLLERFNTLSKDVLKQAGYAV